MSGTWSLATFLLLMRLLRNVSFAYQGEDLRFFAGSEANQIKSISEVKAWVEVKG